MKLNIDNIEKYGVYIIKNDINNKIYIGSTKMSFLKRIWHHLSCLRNNTHKNPILQRSFNKYGEDNFSFHIIEVCENKNDVPIREQFYLDQYFNSHLRSIIFNINPISSGLNTTSEVIEKRKKTIAFILKNSSLYFKKVKNGTMSINDVPDKYKTLVKSFFYKKNGISCFEKGREPWNKGKSYVSTDHLKVPKTITNKVLESRINRINNNRNNSSSIYVYSDEKNLIGIWRSAKDLEEWSKIYGKFLPLKSRFGFSDRMGIPFYYLQSVNINKSCKLNTPYKGLFFSYRPLYQEIDIEKLGKIGENCNVNTEIISKITKGLETS